MAVTVVTVAPPSRLHDPASRAARGKQARASRPRSSLCGWAPPAQRVDPVTILEQQARTRVPELVPIRYGRMAVSPFAFFRGAAAIMAADLGPEPTSGFEAQLCGDAHISNFGGFAAPDRRIVFGINDFDETHPGPFEWDVQRLAASIEIAGRSLGMDDRERAGAVRRMVRSYRDAMRYLAEMTDLDVWYARLDLDGFIAMIGQELGRSVLDDMQRTTRKAQKKDRFKALARLTERVDGELRFVHDPPLVVPAEILLDGVEREELDAMMRELLARYRSTLPYKYRRLLDGYRYVHIARKVVGVGSVGTRAWVVLLVGRDEDDPLILQVKEAEASVLEPYAQPSEFENHGERVVAGQSLMQAAGDIFLGWNRVDGVAGTQHDYYMRQLWDWKASADIDSMKPETLAAYGVVCGRVLAAAHARTGDRVTIASYLGRSDAFDRAMATFAAAYADQNERDHAALVAAIESGRIRAEHGV